MVRSASAVATILQNNPAVLELDRYYSTNNFSQSILILNDVEASNLEIAQAKKIVRTRQEAVRK